jgi:hypothetical protein
MRPRSGQDPRFVLTAALGGIVLLLFPFAPMASASPSWDPAPGSWSNGFVLCEFAPALPTVSVSALTRAQTGLSATVSSVLEVNPAGRDVASSNLTWASWAGANDSTPDLYDLAYTARASVTNATSPSDVLGSVSMRVDYVLPAYEDSSGGSIDTVSLDVQVAGWPWQSPADHLVLVVSAQPAFANEEHLVLGSSTGALVSSVATSSGTSFEQMSGSTQAVANPGSPAPTTITASPSVTGNATGALVSVSFGSSAGAFSAMNYSATVTVLFPSTVAGIPTIDLVAVGAAAVLISILVAVGVRRVRGRPSDLTYVDREEP